MLSRKGKKVIDRKKTIKYVRKKSKVKKKRKKEKESKIK